MMKLNKKLLNSSLVVLLALGLGGCATNSATTTHKTHEASSAKVVKQSSHKKAESKSTSEQSQSSATSTSKSSTSTKSANAAATAKSSSTSTSTSNANNNVTAPAKAANQSSTVKQNQEKQLGLGDVATWTDSEGVTHHVDSDGMDRYTAKGSSQVQYQDFSGSLPSDAVISHQN